MIEDGVQGFLVKVGDVSTLTERLQTIVGDTELRARMGAAARRRYEEEFTIDRFADRLADVWEAAMHAPARRAAA
jgi:glycosyltransferase involved in cell wall biosynthesis